MKGLNKNTESKEVKNESENGKETETQGSSTPEISARSRQSLDGLTAQREDEKEIQILQLQALLAYPNRYYRVLQVPPSTRRTLDVKLGVF